MSCSLLICHVSQPSRSIRHFLSKASRAFDTLHHRHAQDSLQIEALQKKQDELVNKRQNSVGRRTVVFSYGLDHHSGSPRVLRRTSLIVVTAERTPIGLIHLLADLVEKSLVLLLSEEMAHAGW